MAPTRARAPLALALAAVGLSAAFAFTPSKPAAGLPPLAATAGRRTALPGSAAHRAPSVVLQAAAAQPPKGATVSASIANLAKNIVGSGVLALANGIAAYSSARVAVVPSMALLLFSGGVSAYTFSTIARVGAAVGGTSYRETWAKVWGEKSAILPDITVVFMTLAAGLSYSIILGDTFSSIAKLAGAPAILASSNAWIVLLSTFVLLPLALMRDLSSLAIGSIIGTGGTVFTMLFTWLRFFDGSYAPGGKFFAGLAQAPLFAAPSAARPLLNSGALVLLSMLASAFLAHYNAPKMYNELAAPADGSSKLPDFNKVVFGAFGAAAVLMGAIMVGGYLTFGGAASGLILNNYATSDPLAFLARLGIGMSIIFSYPLNMVGLREGLLSMLGKTEAGKKNSVHIGVTLALLLLMNGTSLFLKDLGLVVGLGGAILGSALVYIFPALMAIGEDKGVMGPLEKKANWGLTGLGVFFAGLGAAVCLK